MEKKTLNIFMIDDHPMIIEGYKNILSFNNLGLHFNFTSALNCKEAYTILTNDNQPPFDVVFIDLSLPPFEEKAIFSGEDLALLVKEKFPETKIIILTSHAEAFTLFDLQKKIKPNGLLVKSDFSAEELLVAFEYIIDGKTYESKTVSDAIKELLTTGKNNVLLEEQNREIIRLLSKGILTKNLPNYMNLGQSAIDKRKAQIKECLSIKGGSDEDIVREAKKHGFI
jgi:DNA-binding NarL/FixJ family response regulator